MINITKQKMTIIRIELTPQELRDLAREAEEKQKTMRIGHDRTFKVLFSNNMDIEIKLQVPNP